METKMNQKIKSALFFISTCAISTVATAHIGLDNHEHTGFLIGFLHPIGGLDHLAAMVAVGLWSALTARRAGPELLWGPLCFASMLLAGALIGLQGITITAVEPMIAASLLVTGLLVIGRLRISGIAAALIVGLFAVFHGLAHGYELASSPSAFQTLAGMLTATLMLHATGLALGWALRSTSVWVPRIAGAAVALSGGVMLLQLA